MCAPKREEGAPKSVGQAVLDGDFERLPNGVRRKDVLKARFEKLGHMQPEASAPGIPNQTRRSRVERSGPKYLPVTRSGGSRGRRSLLNP